MKKNNFINSKGISVIFLVIAMLLMITIGYVFSYLIPTKQKSVIFPIYSTQAFYLAQSGVEFAVRFAIGSGWTPPATPVDQVPTTLNNLDGIQRNLGDRGGYFILDYDCPNNTLISKGIIPNVSERWVNVSNFTSFLTAPTGLIIDPRSPVQCWSSGTQDARFYIRNATESSITVTAFSASWTGGRRLRNLYMNSVQKWSGNSTNPIGRTPFNVAPTSQTIASNVAIRVDLDWNNNITGDIVISFYYRSVGVWYYYTFYLNPCGTGMGAC